MRGAGSSPGNTPASPAGPALALLTLVYMVNFMDRQLLSVLAEPVKRDLQLTDTQLGLLGGFMFALFYTTFGVPVAALADRRRRGRVLAGACAAWSLFCAACALASGFGTLALARIGVAVGEAGGLPPTYSLIADLFPPERRGRAMAIHSLGSPIGLGIGTAIAGWVAAQWGWRAAFVAVAAPGLVLAVLLLLLREPPRGHFEVETPAPAPPLGRAIADFFRSPDLLAIAMAGALGGFVCYALMAWISAYMIRILGMSLLQVGHWLSLTLALGLGCGILASGWLVDHFGRRDARAYLWVPGAAMALGLPAYAFALSATDWHRALPLFAIPLALSIFYLAPTAAVIQARVAPARRSTVSALVLLFLNLFGLGLGPVFVGWISDRNLAAMGTRSLLAGMWGLAPMFGLAALAYGIAGWIVGRSGNRLAGMPASAAAPPPAAR